MTAFILSSIGFEALSILYSEASLCLVFVNSSLASAVLSVHYTALPGDDRINRLFVAGGEYTFSPKRLRYILIEISCFQVQVSISNNIHKSTNANLAEANEYRKKRDFLLIVSQFCKLLIAMVIAILVMLYC